MKKLFILLLLPLLFSCTIEERCDSCKDDMATIIRDTIHNTIRDTIVETQRDTIYIDVIETDTLYVDVVEYDTIVETSYDTILQVQYDTTIVVQVDTLTVTEIDTLLCPQKSKVFNFLDFHDGDRHIELEGVDINDDNGYRIVDTYAGKGMYLCDGISFDFSSYGDHVELDHLYYKAISRSGEMVYWDGGQMELPKRPEGQPVYININQTTSGFYLDIRKRMVLLEFGIKYYDCDEN